MVRSMYAECLMSTLISKGVFSSHDQQNVEARETSNEKGEAIMDLIVRKSQGAYDGFIETLQERYHEHIAIELIGFELISMLKAHVVAVKDVEKTDVEVALCEHVQHAFESDVSDLRQLKTLLASNGISLSAAWQSRIILKFRCRDHTAVVSLQELYSSKKLDLWFSESFLPKFADKGLESLSLHVPDEEFQRCFQLKLMTDEHRQLLLSAEEQLVNKMVVSDELLDKLSLCKQRREAIETASTQEEQVKTLLDIVSRQPDCAFTQLLTALNDTNQREAADIISGENRSAKESKAFCRPLGKSSSL